MQILITLREIRCRSSRYMNNCFPNGVTSWIVIITHFKIMPSIGKLKEHLISLFCPSIKSTFDIHNTIAIGPRCILQLRLRLSPLRSHKWCHNSLDTVTDTCNCNQGIEDTDHFLFSCPSFETHVGFNHSLNADLVLPRFAHALIF